MEEIIANLKLQMALQNQLQYSSEVVPNYTKLVRANPCCGITSEPIFNNIPQPRRCCGSEFKTDLELLADQVAVYNQYAPKKPCCKGR